MRSHSRPTSGDPISEEAEVVEVYVRSLDQLFDSMDPSPFFEKGLDSSAQEYIVAAAKELPGGAPEALVVYLDRSVGLPDEGHTLGEAIRKHFARQAQLLQWRLRRLFRHGAVSLAIGPAVFTAALTAGEHANRLFGAGHVATVLGQSLHIGGSVAMWHPMEIFLYEWWPLLSDRRLYERLSRMPIQIVYAGKSEPSNGTRVAEMDGVARPAPRRALGPLKTW